MDLAFIRARLAREDGQALVEYALIVSFIAIAAIVALGLLSNGVNGIFTDIATKI